ncbi:MAG: hypothetical protein JW384_01620 [Nitrosomonadaceae bacterium]|nr:hypothetical protein [Nitrosomonadaceae bacterium]
MLFLVTGIDADRVIARGEQVFREHLAPGASAARYKDSQGFLQISAQQVSPSGSL